MEENIEMDIIEIVRARVCVCVVSTEFLFFRIGTFEFLFTR
jgi:hypothetical protein